VTGGYYCFVAACPGGVRDRSHYFDEPCRTERQHRQANAECRLRDRRIVIDTGDIKKGVIIELDGH
jgi:hypothetical protein